MTTNREAIKAYYRAEDARRLLCEPEFRTDVYKIRKRLENLHPDEIIKYRCFNDIEVEMIKEALTPEELKRVTFTWLEFKN